MINWLIPVAKAQFTLGLPINGSNNHYTSFEQYFTDLISLAVTIAGILAVIIVVYAGLLYSRSQGKSEQVSQAKELVSGALIGMAILLLIRLVIPTLGINVN